MKGTGIYSPVYGKMHIRTFVANISITPVVEHWLEQKLQTKGQLFVLWNPITTKLLIQATLQLLAFSHQQNDLKTVETEIVLLTPFPCSLALKR